MKLNYMSKVEYMKFCLSKKLNRMTNPLKIKIISKRLPRLQRKADRLQAKENKLERKLASLYMAGTPSFSRHPMSERELEELKKATPYGLY